MAVARRIPERTSTARLKPAELIGSESSTHERAKPSIDVSR